MNEALLGLLVEALQRSPPPPERNSCSSPITDLQFGHSIARFNDTSSQVVNAAQQAFVQQQGAQFAQLLKLTSDMTNGDD